MENEPKYQVYCHYNKVNGKSYYGATKNTWEERWKTKYPSNLHFNRAIKKYGEENWTHEVIAEGLTREQAAEWEKAYIDFFDTTNPENGYNKGRGGEGLNELDSLYAKMRSREYHEALSEAMRKVWGGRTDAERKALGEICTAHFDRDELSRRSKGLWESPEYRNKIKRTIAKKMEARRKDPEYIKDREIAKIRRKERQHRYHVERYVAMDAEMKRRHYSDAQRRLWESAEYRNAASERMRRIMQDPEVRERIRLRRLGTQHTEQELTAISNGMKEKWKDPEFRAAQKKERPKRTDEQKSRIREKASEKHGRSVLCVETEVEYPSKAAAARAIGMEKKAFSNALKKQSTIRGQHWVLGDKIEESGVSVICVETGVEYESIKEAERATEISASSICGVCQGRRKTAGGLHWKYADATNEEHLTIS